MKAKLKQQCNQLARVLDLPPAWSVSELASRLSTLRGRPVHIDSLPRSQPGEVPCGIWISTDNADYIYARQGTSDLHHKHFVLHEVGHMMCGHQGLDPAVGLAAMLPHVPPDIIRRALRRTTYSDPQEQEAESFADLLYHYTTRNLASRQESDQLAQRARLALGIRD